MIAAGADKACEVLGWAASIPTRRGSRTARRRRSTPRRASTARFSARAAVSGGAAGRFDCEVQIYRGYWMVCWFKERVRPPRAGAGRRAWRHREPVRRAGRRGAGGLDGPDAAAVLVARRAPSRARGKGAIIGFGDVHTRAHVYRAILEGLAYALRDGGERIGRRRGIRSAAACVRRRIAVGRGDADHGRHLPPAGERPHDYETSGLGAAMTRAVALGLHADFTTAVRAMTRKARPSSRAPTLRSTKSSTSRSIAACTRAWRRSMRAFAASPAIRPERAVRR